MKHVDGELHPKCLIQSQISSALWLTNINHLQNKILLWLIMAAAQTKLEISKLKRLLHLFFKCQQLLATQSNWNVHQDLRGFDLTVSLTINH